MFLLILKQKLLGLRNSVNRRTVLRRLPFIALGAGAWVLSYVFTYKVISFIRSVEFFGEALSEKLFSMIFFSLTGFLILSNIITALSAYYLSKDIPFLLSKPIGVPDIIRLKTFETVINSSWMVLSFTPPALIAYGVVYKTSAAYYASVFASLLMLVLITAGIGISIAHILTGVFPARRSRDMLLGLGLVLFLLLYFVIRSAIPQDLSGPGDIFRSFMEFKADSPLFPGYWITSAVTPLFRKGGLDFFYFLVLLSNSAFFLFVSSFIGSRFYTGNFSRIQPAGKGAGRALRRIYPARGRAVLYKDVKTFYRDTGQWSQIFIIGALIMVYVYNFRAVPVAALSEISPFVKEIMVFANMAMAGLVLSAVAARFLYTSISLEGRAFWIMRTSPVDAGRLLWSKFLYGCVPVTSLIMFIVFLVDSALKVQSHLMAVSLITTLMLCISVSGLGTGFGAVYPRFKYENITSVSMGLGGIVFMLIAFLVVLVTLSLEAWIFYLWSIRTGVFTFPEKIQVSVGLLLVLLVNAAAFYIPMKAGGKRLRAMEF